MIDKAKKSEYGAVWYSDRGPIQITKEGELMPLFGHTFGKVVRRNAMQWMEIKFHPVDEEKIHFTTNGKTVFMLGAKSHPFLIQFSGDYTKIADFEPTHWTTLPDLNEIYDK